jgi:hypothetical protein
LAVQQVSKGDEKPKVGKLESFGKFLDVGASLASMGSNVNNMVNPKPGSSGLPVAGYKNKGGGPELKYKGKGWNPMQEWLNSQGNK